MKSILIADAGSTKTNWSLISNDNEEIIRFVTKGINPALQNSLEITERIKDIVNRIPEVTVSDIYFYGAGCVGTVQKNKIKDSLKKFWKNARIEIESDIFCAAKALFGSSEGIACILGTGSNSCYFKDNKIISRIPSLGFILGDEGSGAALGKRLLNNVFKKQLSISIIENFNFEFHLSVEELINRVYREPMPSSFLASFSLFLKKHLKEPEIHTLIISEFDSFFEKNIIPYDNYRSINIGFIGSIAEHFADLLIESAHKYEIKISKILKDPMPSLEKYFSEK